MMAAAVIIFLVAYNSRPLDVGIDLGVLSSPCVIIDAGHGGADGGAVSDGGTIEATVNLQIAEKTDALMRLLGIYSVMTRTDGGSLDFCADATLRENKVSDIRKRLAISREMSDCEFLSIHLNKFPEHKYHGAQVFYGLLSPKSESLAQCIQDAFSACVDSENTRKIKPAPKSVFLMQNIASPTVTVECGFLSNPEEEVRLKDGAYQIKIAMAIAKGYIDYKEGGLDGS